eukprot:TRINITY_DN7862_c0_g1_i3.p1 TRINITY_DN7862_c0_g1~~TRINITY_DN7862_c0_g1_i3.p1  ORF type:complete len:390 (+),score=56.15 TRINITY_DN7862_c0_g1_i3:764-1933(+)
MSSSIEQKQKTRQIRSISYPDSQKLDRNHKDQPIDSRIVITVIDEINKSSHEYICNRFLLCEKAKYFETYLARHSRASKIGISVHCDWRIFQWLMQYIEKPESQPLINAQNVMSILVSSNFLMMEELVLHCIEYIRKNVNYIVRLPIDFSSLPSKLLHQLANLMTEEEVDNMDDRKDRLQSKLFMAKIEGLAEDSHNLIMKCKLCGMVLTTQSLEWMNCSRSSVTIDHRGSIKSRHIVDDEFDVYQYISSLYEAKRVWKLVFWHLWGISKAFSCVKCKSQFLACDIATCRTHTGSLILHPDTGIKRYSCCGVSVFQVEPLPIQSGCSMQYHIIDRNTAQKIYYDMLIKRLDAIQRAPSLISQTAADSTSQTKYLKHWIEQHQLQVIVEM